MTFINFVQKNIFISMTFMALTLSSIPSSSAIAAGAEATPAEDTNKDAFFVDMPAITVNLRSSGRQQRYLKLKVRFEVKQYEHVDIIENIMPRIRDQFQVFLRELRVEDLEGATGAYRIREELLVRINAVSRPAVVSDVLFDELLVQ